MSDKPLVLVIEENRDMNRFISQALEQKFRVEQAFDGPTGVEKALALTPDLVVSDLTMPSMSGEELLIQMRAQPSLDSVPIMFLTAKVDEGLRVRLLEEGAQDFVMKQSSPSEMVARAANLVSVKRTREILQRELHSQAHDLEQLAAEMTYRKRQLTTAVESARVAREQAEGAIKTKSNFLSMLSHELRTPLAALLLQLERMRIGDLTNDQRELGRRMTLNAMRLQSLIEGLLRYSEIEGRGLIATRSPIELPALLRDILDELRPQADEKRIALLLETEPIPPLINDLGLIRLVVTNLVENGIKFTEAGSVTVQLSHTGGEHRISVVDTGPGIPREDQPRIWEPFVQGEEIRNKHIAGVGLGLALVREMTSSAGGSILLDSELGRGSRFTVSLPMIL